MSIEPEPLNPENCLPARVANGKYEVDGSYWSCLEYDSPLLAHGRGEEYDERRNAHIFSLMLANQGIVLGVRDEVKKFEEELASANLSFSGDMVSIYQNILAKNDAESLQNTARLIDDLEELVKNHEIVRLFAKPSEPHDNLAAYVCGISMRGLASDYEEDGPINPVVELTMADGKGNTGLLPAGYRSGNLLVPDSSLQL